MASQSKKELINENKKQIVEIKNIRKSRDSLQVLLNKTNETLLRRNQQFTELEYKFHMMEHTNDSLSKIIGKRNYSRERNISDSNYDRIDTYREIPVFEKSSGIITKAKGWGRDDVSGKWFYSNNVLEKRSVANVEKLNPISMSYEEQNFLSIQTKKLKYNNENYYVLMIKKYVGTFKYPTILKDWNYSEVMESYIFPEDEYVKLYNITEHTVLHTTFHYSRPIKFDEEYFLEAFHSYIVPKSQSFEYEFVLRKVTSNGQEVVRFLLPYNDPHFHRYNINMTYFELPVNDFEKIILK